MSDLVADLDKVGQDIRSLLISAPNGLTPSMLERDYKEVVGRQLPYRKFGFFSCLEFARSLDETVRISMQGGTPLLFGVPDKNTKHILKLVQKQKKSKFYSKLSGQQNKPSFKRKRQPVQFSHPSAYMQSGILKVVQKFPNGFPVSKLHTLYKEVNETPLNIENVESIPSVIMQMPDIASLEFGRKDLSGNNLYIYPAAELTSHKNLLKSKLKLRETAKLLKANKLTKSLTTFSSSVTTTSCTATSTSPCLTSPVSTNSSGSVMSAKQTVTEKRFSTPCSKTSQNRSRTTQIYSDTSPSHSSQSINSKNHPSVKKTTLQRTKNCGNDNFKVTSPFEPIIPPSVSLLQEEIVEMLRDCTNGICSINIPSLYEQKFNKELDLHRHGYYSVIEFIVSMTDRVHMCRLSRSGDWLLKLRSDMSSQDTDTHSTKSEKSNVDLSKVKSDIKELIKKYKGGIIIKSLEDVYKMHFGRQLPIHEIGLNSVAELMCMLTDKVDILNDELCLKPSSCVEKPPEPSVQSSPVDAVGRGICYHPPSIPLKEWGFFDCFVSHVVTPGDFTIQVMSEETTKALDILMDEMEQVYNHRNAREYKMPHHMAKSGQICVVLYQGDNNWNRAVITSDPQSGFVDVTYVDYGDVASVSVDSLYLMKSRFLSLPALRIRCRLAHLKPPDLETWSPETKRAMLGICKNKPMVAEVVSTDDHDVISILLCDTSQDDVDLYLNDVLLDKGLAIYVPDDATEDHVNFVRENIERKKREERRRLGILTDSSVDIPHESPPPYQERDTLHHEEVTSNTAQSQDRDTGLQAVGAAGSIVLPAVKSSSLCEMKIPFGGPDNPLPLQQFGERCNLLRTGVFERTTALGTDNLHNGLEHSSKSISQSPSNQQKRYVKLYLLKGNIPIHVVNYEGNALVASGEISSLFRPKSRDLLVPMLLLKDLHFSELALINNAENSALFAEFKARQVKGTYSADGMKSSVSLYLLSDVPAILEGLEHNDKTMLKKEFAKIMLSFDPNESYWFSDGTAFDDQEHLDCSLENKINDATEKPISLPTDEQKQYLMKKRDELLQELVKPTSSSQKPALLKSLSEVLAQLGAFGRGPDSSQTDNLEPVSKNDNDEQNYSSDDICAIPSERDSYTRLTNIFSGSNTLDTKPVDFRQALSRGTYS